MSEIEPHTPKVRMRTKDEIFIEAVKLEEMIRYYEVKKLNEMLQKGELSLMEIMLSEETWEGWLSWIGEAEEKYGKENLPQNDYEWWVVNGKMTALRWVEWNEMEENNSVFFRYNPTTGEITDFPPKTLLTNGRDN